MNWRPVTAPWWACLMTVPSLLLSWSHTATWPAGLLVAIVWIVSAEDNTKKPHSSPLSIVKGVETLQGEGMQLVETAKILILIVTKNRTL